MGRERDGRSLRRDGGCAQLDAVVLRPLDLAGDPKTAQAGQANPAVASEPILRPLATPRGRARGGKLGSSTRRCPPTAAATEPGPARGREGSDKAKDLHRKAWQTSLDSWQSCAGCGKRGEREASAANPTLLGIPHFLYSIVIRITTRLHSLATSPPPHSTRRFSRRPFSSTRALPS